MESAEEQSVRLDTVPDEEQVVEVPLKVPSKQKEESGSEDEEDGEESEEEKKQEKEPYQEQDGEEVLGEEEQQENDDAEYTPQKNKEELNIHNYMGADGILRSQSQREKEALYKEPEKPTLVGSGSRWRRLEVRRVFDNFKEEVALFNFVAEDYRGLLKKLLPLVPFFPNTLRFLIVSLPSHATSVDLYYARMIQASVARQGRDELETTILFITHEDHKKLVNQFWVMHKTEGLKIIDTMTTPISLQASIAESTLCYSWGSAYKGALGTGLQGAKCDLTSGFQRRDGEHFTCEPQPLVALLGKKVRKVEAGKEHFICLASNGKIFTWGDNSKSQLGLDPTQLMHAGKGKKHAEGAEELEGIELDEAQKRILSSSVPYQVTTKPLHSHVA
jgi:hypothetical protein